MATPNATDQYSRFMAELFDDRNIQSAPTGFLSLFGNPAAPSRTHFSEDEGTIEIDIIKANGQRLAELVHRGQSSDDVSRQKNITDQNFTNIVRQYPLIEEESNINSTQLIKRLAGDNPTARRRQMDRNQQLALDLSNEHIRRSARTWEYLAAQSIITGKMPAIIGTSNTDLQYDFYRKATHTVTVSAVWDTGTPDILGDIDGGLSLIKQDAYMKGDMMLVGGTVMNALIADSTLQTLADNRRFELIQVSLNNPVPPRFNRYVDAGWTAYGRLRTPLGREVWMFTNDDIYTNSSGTTVNFMPLTKVVLMPSEARMDRYFGPRDRMPLTSQERQWYQEMFGFNMDMPPIPPNFTANGIILPEAFYHDAYMPDGAKNVVMRSQSAPIFATTQTDAIVVLTGLIT